MENSYKFFNNKMCKYFPCHKNINEDEFNCLFCFCPLHFMKDKCGGNFEYIKGNIKNCANCTLPHKSKYYDTIIEKLKKGTI